MNRVAFICVLACIGAPAWADNFVRATGDQLTLNGEIFKLKGTNYYPRFGLWANMWNVPFSEIQEESALVRDLGLNCVRILVPYSNGGWNGPNVPESRLALLEQIVNEFGVKGIRSCVTLFDWETSFPAAGTSREAQHIQYLSLIVNRLKDNPYVLMWDVKNEPDHPANYGSCDCAPPGRCGKWDCNPSKKNQIVSWLNRMCNAVKARDANHLVCCGMRWWENVDETLPFVDVAVFHSYWPNIGTEEIPVVKGYMGSNQKPIVVQEWGWPSHPNPCLRDGQLITAYNETEQYNLYVQHLTAFEQHNITGGLQWMTFDGAPYTYDQNHTFEDYFGLWYNGLGLKPAGVYYRDQFPVSQFPALNDTTPPAAVTDVTATPLPARIRVSWLAPANTDYKGAIVRVSTAGFPAAVTDGQLAADGRGRPGLTGSIDHTGIAPNVTYYYTVFAYDTSGNFAPGVPLSGTSSPFGTITGTVRDQYGQPVSGATITTGGSDPATTAGNGSFSVPVLVGMHSVTAAKIYFASAAADGVTVHDGQTTAANITITAMPPAPVATFTVTASSLATRLEWTNPTSGNYRGTMIRFSTTAPPASPADGTLLVNATASAGTTGAFNHAGLTNGVTYHYTAFTYDNYSPRNYSAGIARIGQPSIVPDRDHDGDVDQTDFAEFQICLSGRAVPQDDPVCRTLDFDLDADVDADDFTRFMTCYSGPDIAAKTACP